MFDYSLTQKANFVESDSQALANIIHSVGILYTMLDNIVKSVNQDEELALNLWAIGAGMQSAAELYVAAKVKGDNNE